MGPTDLRTAKHKLLDRLMIDQSGHDLEHYVREQRLAGASWRRITTAVTAATGVSVTDQTLNEWFGPDDEAAE
jgi:hypothetical protein